MYTQEQRQERIERAVETVGERIDAATCYMNKEDRINSLYRIKYEVESQITAATLVESTPDETVSAR